MQSEATTTIREYKKNKESECSFNAEENRHRASEKNTFVYCIHRATKDEITFFLTTKYFDNIIRKCFPERDAKRAEIVGMLKVKGKIRKFELRMDIDALAMFFV